MAPMRLADMTWAQTAGRPLLVVPVGSTEQHGPHLPLSTDTDIAAALAQRLAGALPGTVVAPALAYGASGEHQGFPGTVSIGQDATELALVELVRSASATFARTMLVCAHGGNAAPLARAVTCLRSEGRDVIAWSPDWSGDAHAGRAETSVMLALAPERVDLPRAVAGNRAPVEELLPDLVRDGVRAVSANGVLGDPAGASADEGRRLLDTATRDLLDTAATRLAAAAR
jgi:mycofactocin precursor peptide peptidase